MLIEIFTCLCQQTAPNGSGPVAFSVPKAGSQDLAHAQEVTRTQIAATCLQIRLTARPQIQKSQPTFCASQKIISKSMTKIND